MEGVANTACGDGALASNTLGTHNTACGSDALETNLAGVANTACGDGALRNNIFGAFNTAIGCSANVSAGNLTNATAIGANAIVSASNSLVLGGTGSHAVNVGIGTTSPGVDLAIVDAVSPSIHLRRDGSNEWFFTATPGGSDRLGIRFGGNLDANERLTIATGGNVGIKTISPDRSLDVSGTITGTGWDAFWTTAGWGKTLELRPGAAIQWLKEAGTISRGIGTSGDILYIVRSTADDVSAAPTYDVVVDASGNVGIGTTSPAAKLHVDGTAGNNTGVWSNLSDRRLKKDVEPIEGALQTVEQLEGVSFRWKDEKKDAQFGRVRGLIAQDVEKVLPEWIKTDPDGYKRLEPIGVDALLIEAIKELKAENEELKKRIFRLEQSRPQAKVE